MAAEVTVRPAVEADYAIGQRLRFMDRRECELMGVAGPTGVRLSSARSVACWACEVDGEVVSVFGISRREAGSPVGIPWLLGTDGMDDMTPVQLMRAAFPILERMARVFPRMENFIWVENKVSIDWLTWLGFDMDEPAPHGPYGAPFIRFTKGMR